jgi:hypothetical protein
MVDAGPDGDQRRDGDQRGDLQGHGDRPDGVFQQAVQADGQARAQATTGWK